MNDPYILRKGHYPFLVWKIEPDSRPIVDKTGFSSKSMLAYRMILIVAPLAGLSEDDVLNPDLAEPEAARVLVYMAIEEYEQNGQKMARAWMGGNRGANKLVVAQSNGRDVLRGDVFHAIVEASGADITVQGEAQPRPGVPAIKPVWLKVDAVEGKGDYPAKNVFRAWSVSKDEFEKELVAQAKALAESAQAIAATPKNADGTAVSPLAASLKASAKPEPRAPVAALAPGKKRKDTAVESDTGK